MICVINRSVIFQKLLSSAGPPIRRSVSSPEDGLFGGATRGLSAARDEWGDIGVWLAKAKFRDAYITVVSGGC